MERRKRYEGKKDLPKQAQRGRPGRTAPMEPQPEDRMSGYVGSRKLDGIAAIVTGGDSGIGRAVAVAFAREGADVGIVYLNEHEDANRTKELVEDAGRRALLVSGDVGSEAFCAEAVSKVREAFGRLDVLVNNAAEQHPQESIEDVSERQLKRTFRTNVFSLFFMTKAALPHLGEGASIINTASVTAYKGNPTLLDYSATKGAVVAFTRSLALSLSDRKIRVNAVAPGPIWTPLIPSTFPPERVESFGGDVPLGRVGQPDEVAPCFVFLASEDSTYMTGQTLHPNGGTIVNG